MIRILLSCVSQSTPLFVLPGNHGVFLASSGSRHRLRQGPMLFILTVQSLSLWSGLFLVLGGWCGLLLGRPATWRWCCVTSFPSQMLFQYCSISALSGSTLVFFFFLGALASGKKKDRSLSFCLASLCLDLRSPTGEYPGWIFGDNLLSGPLFYWYISFAIKYLC